MFSILFFSQKKSPLFCFNSFPVFPNFLSFLSAHDLLETCKDIHSCAQTCRLVHDLESDMRAWTCAPQPIIITSHCLTQTARARHTRIISTLSLLFLSPLFCSCLFFFFVSPFFFIISFFSPSPFFFSWQNPEDSEDSTTCRTHIFLSVPLSSECDILCAVSQHAQLHMFWALAQDVLQRASVKKITSHLPCLSSVRLDGLRTVHTYGLPGPCLHC